MRLCPVALILATLVLTGSALGAELHQVGRVAWEGEVVFGISGLEVSDDGRRFEAVSDAGWRYAGRLARRGEALEAVEMKEIAPILGNDGLPVAARRVGDWSDAEGLAIAPDGTSWIAFERWSRIQRFEPGNPVGQWIRDHPDFYTWKENRQLEAVAVDATGAIYAMAEQPVDGAFPIYVLRDDGWTIESAVPERNGFAVVGADFAPDGTLWLLERKHYFGTWWRNRISRVEVARPEEIETVWTGDFDEFYNLEGIAVWQASDGLRLLCVTDNNMRRNVDTELVEFRLQE